MVAIISPALHVYWDYFISVSNIWHFFFPPQPLLKADTPSSIPPYSLLCYISASTSSMPAHSFLLLHLRAHSTYSTVDWVSSPSTSLPYPLISFSGGGRLSRLFIKIQRLSVYYFPFPYELPTILVGFNCLVESIPLSSLLNYLKLLLHWHQFYVYWLNTHCPSMHPSYSAVLASLPLFWLVTTYFQYPHHPCSTTSFFPFSVFNFIILWLWSGFWCNSVSIKLWRSLIEHYSIRNQIFLPF